MADPAQQIEEQEELSTDDLEQQERELFEKAIEEDPDLTDEAPAPEPKLEQQEEEDEGDEEDEGPPAAREVEQQPDQQAEPQQLPTGLEWLNDLPEDRRTAAQDFIARQGQTIARLDQRVQSHLGQLRPAQRALSQMQRKLRQLEEAQAKTQQRAIPDSMAKQREETLKWIETEYADFPEEAAKLKARFNESFDGVLSGMPAQPKPQPRAPAGPDRNEEIHHLQTAYSDWGERRYSPEFQEWIKHQNEETRRLITSPFAADNIALLDAFTRDNPDWIPPQTPDDFYSLAQAKHSPLFRGWAEGEGINPDINPAALPDFQRDAILTRFKRDLGGVLNELEQAGGKSAKLRQRRSQQLQNRDPGARRLGVTPGEKIDLNTEEGQRAYFNQLIAADPDLKNP